MNISGTGAVVAKTTSSGGKEERRIHTDVGRTNAADELQEFMIIVDDGCSNAPALNQANSGLPLRRTR